MLYNAVKVNILQVSDSKSKITNFLIPISFAMSITAMSLVVIESQNFTEKNSQNEKILHISKGENTKIKTFEEKSKEYVGQEIDIQEKSNAVPDNTKDDGDAKSVSKQSDSAEINDLIKDLESAYAKPKQNSLQQVKNEQNNISISDKSVGGNYKMRLKSFDDKDDAILELNRIRIQHKDLMSKIETSVKPYKISGKTRFGIFAKVKNGDKKASDDVCDKFEARSVECTVFN